MKSAHYCSKIWIPLIISMIFSWIAVPATFAQETTATYKGMKDKLHVYVLIGGQTMAGRAPMTEDDSKVIDRCFLLNAQNTWEPAKGPLNRYSSIRNEKATQALGPGIAFAKKLLAADPTISIGLVVNAGEGKENYVEHWRYKDDVYRQARNRIKAACKTGALKGILWHQDGNRIDSSLSYLKDLAANLRVDVGQLNLPFVVGGVPGDDANAKAYDSKYKTFIADVHASGYASAKGVSRDRAGMQVLGEQYAAEMLRIQKEWSVKPKPKGTFTIIDVHTHATPCKKDGLDAVAKWMERNGVSRCITMPLRQSRAKTKEDREIMLANFRKYRGKIYRFCIIEPDEVKTVDEAVEILKREKAEGAIGFGEHYGHDLMFDDPKNMRLYEACATVGLPVLFHIDNNKNMDEKGLPHLENALKAYPKCIFIAHAQFWLQFPEGTCDRLLQTYPNLYADPSGLRMATVLNRDRAYTRKFLIRNADKIMFGTDAGWWSFGKKKEDREILFEVFEQLDLPDAVKHKIYHGNAEKLFGFKTE